jgi:hypothetical protein
MLSSLLPGLRELRAPLAAGVLWLLALWFLAEPSLPTQDEATGLLASAYRLAEPLSALGLGAALGFTAFLVGSLSVFVFSGVLRRLIPTTATRGRWTLTGLSESGREALGQVARDGRQRLEEIVSLSGSGVDDVLRTMRPTPGADPFPSKFIPRRSWWRRVAGRRGSPAVLSADTAARSQEEEQEAVLAGLVVRDLGTIANTQLLGRENDVFSAIDRDRAEVDFRLAVIPALVALTVALATRAPSPAAAAVVVLVGSAASVGLMLDAGRQQRLANDLLLNLLEDNRIAAPSFTRLESRAKQIAEESPAGIVSRQARALSIALQALLGALTRVLKSGAVTLDQVLDSAVTARAAFDRLQVLLQEFGQPPLDRSVLDDLEFVTRAWVGNSSSRDYWPSRPEVTQLLAGELPPWDTQAAGKVIERARQALPSLVDDMRRRARTVSAREAAEREVPADAP